MIIERLGWAEALHPRAAGGKFAVKAGARTGGKTAGPATRPRMHAGGGDSAALSFDGHRGAGYGHKGGDRRVHALQAQLNRLGMSDGAGKALVLDGKLGPKTTAAIKRAQRMLGEKPTGVATPELLVSLRKVRMVRTGLPAKKSVPLPAKKATHHRTTPHRAAKKVAPAKKAIPPAKTAPAKMPRRVQP